jgi:hypothetical protein
MNALATLKNAFIRTVKAQEALLAAKMEEEIWLFRGKLRALFQDLGFTQEINAGHLDKSKSLQFKNQPWSFLKVSEQYILGDCKALFQVLGMLKLEKKLKEGNSLDLLVTKWVRSLSNSSIQRNHV